MARVKDPSKIDRLFEAALRHVLETGYAGLKMAEVAREAGVATGTIYTYFGGKADLINQLYRHLKQQKMEAIMQEHDPEAPLTQQIKLLWTNYFRDALGAPVRNHFIRQYEYSDLLDEESRKLHKNSYKPVYALLEKAKRAGLIRQLPVDTMTAFLIGGANEIAHQGFGQQIDLQEQDIERCHQLAWGAIKQV